MKQEYIEPVKNYLMTLQDRICSALEEEDGRSQFHEDIWQRAEGAVDVPVSSATERLLNKAALIFRTYLERDCRLRPLHNVQN